ncbi:MAG TPA: type II secretion system protein [Chthoniobacteraceae bacterium]|jgi:prepilin-type N-terminal cleavage/methylation domain-containing protein|nr:type II secretion system protein [Chthoniobacteraceae bacterium]
MKKSLAAFTLIELLVVISIIAILAALIMPSLTAAGMNAQMVDALNNARQIGLAMRMYAGDNSGNYVSGTNSYSQPIVYSNDAFRSLVPTYVDNEKIFTIPRATVGSTTDNKINPDTNILTPGENAFSYIEGLNTSSNSNWPLIVDEDSGNGYYTTTDGVLGGQFKGTKAVVIHTDISAALVPLLGANSQRYIPEFDDSTQNALTVSNYMGANVQLIEPAH